MKRVSCREPKVYKRYLNFLLIGAILYPLWTFSVLLMPEYHETFLWHVTIRTVVGVFCLIMWGCSIRFNFFKAKIVPVFFVSMCLITGQFMYIANYYKFDLVHIIGTYILILCGCSLFASVKELLSYYLFSIGSLVMSGSVLFLNGQTALFIIVLAGILTFMLISFFSTFIRIKMQDELEKNRDSLSQKKRELEDLNERIVEEREASNIRLATELETLSKKIREDAGRVSQTGTEVSKGASSQAEILKTLTAGVSDFSVRTRANAENASHASRLTIDAKAFVEEGVEKMGSVVASMIAIGESTKLISKIIKAIDGIAFQTSILSINAAVEAARAGKHGKGFAVVAQEVRVLSTRSAEAASDTAALIKQSVASVEQGNNIVWESAEALNEIKNLITNVTDYVGDIASACNEQSLEIEAINEGLAKIEKITLLNSRSAILSGKSGNKLSEHSGKVINLINAFLDKEKPLSR